MSRSLIFGNCRQSRKIVVGSGERKKCVSAYCVQDGYPGGSARAYSYRTFLWDFLPSDRCFCLIIKFWFIVAWSRSAIKTSCDAESSFWALHFFSPYRNVNDALKKEITFSFHDTYSMWCHFTLTILIITESRFIYMVFLLTFTIINLFLTRLEWVCLAIVSHLQQ